MYSLKQQILALIAGTILVLSLGFMFTMAVWLKDRAELASITKVKSDLATCEEIIDLQYPGPWKVENGFLYKGETLINNNFEIVDKISKLTGDTCTIFMGDTRVATTVREKTGERAVGTRVSDVVAKTVLKNGNLYIGEARVLSDTYQTAYKPVRDESGKIIGMLYVGAPKKFYNEMYYGSLKRVAFSCLLLAVLVSLLVWYFTHKTIIQPLKELTLGSKDFVTKGVFRKVNIRSRNEIGELAEAFNEMTSKMEKIISRFEQVAGLVNNHSACDQGSAAATALGRAGESPENGRDSGPAAGGEREGKIPSPVFAEGNGSSGELPKGLNEVTLKHILEYMQKNAGKSLSADVVAEGVGFTRVTVRRYLDYLEKNNQVEVEFKYGSVGRPVKLYKLNKKV